MRRRILSFVLIAGMLLVMTPDTVMAARMEGKSIYIWEKVAQTETETDSGLNTEKEAEKDGVPNAEAEADAGAGSFPDMEGAGTAESPYRIQNAEQLRAFADMVNGVGSVPNTGLCAVLTQNIDLSGVCGADIGSWTPIGTKKNPYTGSFDGGSFTVSGLYYHKTKASYVGLFGCNAGVVRNVGVVGADIAAGSYTGGVCGYNLGTITGCYHASSVKGDRYTGGVCGYNDGSGTVSVCYNTGAVSGSKYVGGICGYNKNETSGCYNMGVVKGSSTSVGGICGYNKRLVSGCYNTGEISGGKNYVGSICGYNHSESAFSNCYYLITGNEKGNYGAAMTQQQFASGEVCWLLNEGKSENIVWHQTCGAGFPVFGGKTVYRTQAYKNDGSAVYAYTNDKNKKGVSAQAAPAATADSAGSSGENTDGSTDDTADGNTEGHVYEKPKWEWEKYESAKAVFTCRDCGEKLTLKASVSKKTTEATCAAEGKTVYTASVDRDGHTYRDTKTVKIEKTGHPSFVPVTKKDATCEEPGIRQNCQMCPVCGKYFDQQGTTEIPSNEVVVNALGHEYGEGEPKWSWKSKYSLLSAEFTCARCHKTDVIEVEPDVETKASCTEAGTITYRAVVNFNSKDYPYEEIIKDEKLPHDFSGEPEWKWGEGHLTATATFTCAYGCENTEVLTAKADKKETRKATCIAEGIIEYKATVNHNGQDYSVTYEEEIPVTGHSYGEPQWTWAEDFSTATATFTCDGCSTSEPKTVETQKKEPEGVSCGASGKIIYTATVTFQGKTYTKSVDGEEVRVPHTTVRVAPKDPDCEEAGNDEYWKCSNCPAMFEDEEGTREIQNIPEIPALGHIIKKGEDGQYECTRPQCKMKFNGVTEKDGTISFRAVEDGAVIPPDEIENDNTAGSDGDEQEKAEPAKGETPPQPDPEEKREGTVPQPAEGQGGQKEQSGENSQTGQEEKAEESSQSGQKGQTGEGTQPGQEAQAGEDARDGQEGQAKESSQAGQEGQAGEGAQNGQEAQAGESSQNGQDIQAGEGGQNGSVEQAGESGQSESRDGVIDAPENAGRCSLVYPEGAETEDVSLAEGNVVNLRAEKSGGDAVQTAREWQGLPAWVAAAALAALVGIVLFFVLKRENN